MHTHLKLPTVYVPVAAKIIAKIEVNGFIKTYCKVACKKYYEEKVTFIVPNV